MADIQSDTDSWPFGVKPLPYSYDALEPYIDRRTLHFHHDKHLKAYVDNLNKALEPFPAYHGWSLEQLLTRITELPASIQTPVKNNAGGVYNHQLYFELMSGDENRPCRELLRALTETFGSFDGWKALMKEAAVSVFGSGWAWLTTDSFGKLQVVQTANQNVPFPLRPLLLIDVWEHAYYLQYQNLRADYVEGWFHLIDWSKVCKRYLMRD